MIEEAYSNYIWLYGEFEDNMQLIHQYKRRGFKIGRTVPTLAKPQISDVIKAIRAGEERTNFNLLGGEVEV